MVHGHECDDLWVTSPFYPIESAKHRNIPVVSVCCVILLYFFGVRIANHLICHSLHFLKPSGPPSDDLQQVKQQQPLPPNTTIAAAVEVKKRYEQLPVRAYLDQTVVPLIVVSRL